ncbi:PaaX family transcriptional regulator C-terminal domain-containing protein [Phaeovulum sp. W22_SRMD_FR3]|uniref:PaaX family transcriptional regulator C-terminal domain-containing protein n=1 Tax=Phaeovulum sp. W22_SRMD_FR3 TaxID=3240274 RepID=UPI003F98CB1D
MIVSSTIETLTDGLPLTAASFIITIYGDLVVPRGEVLWMGSLIDICARVGISENLVRTATSRLVAAGRLQGERNGRRSYYRLAAAARAEFAEAARLLYETLPEPQGWLIQQVPGLADESARRHHMARMGGDIWITSSRGQTPLPGVISFAAEVVDAAAPDIVSQYWDLGPLQDRYAAMIARFAPLERASLAGQVLSASDALIARLLLVQAYRSAVLRDPCLPTAALPADWQGTAARALFRKVYAALTPLAETQLGLTLEGRDGLLAAQTPQDQMRRASWS